ncbi:hypothetical protein ZWY2020_018792 [Hordeum vulgare]|nr:hypothetical protein ZWY2020_018792 [Hordeum vulgare]
MLQGVLRRKPHHFNNVAMACFNDWADVTNDVRPRRCYDDNPSASTMMRRHAFMVAVMLRRQVGCFNDVMTACCNHHDRYFNSRDHPTMAIRKYWFRPRLLERTLIVKQAFVPRADNIILATQPKCGTTWIKALAFTITNRSRYGFDDHPLLTRHPQHVVPFIEIAGGVGANRPDIHALPSRASPRTSHADVVGPPPPAHDHEIRIEQPGVRE